MNINMKKLNMHTKNFVDANIAKISELFPHCITETYSKDGSLKRAVDLDQLRQELSDSIVEGPQERYQLNWPGKREALVVSNAPIAKTLRPFRKESVDFDSTKNLFIECDNLDALKLLQETYLNKIKVIYIDPPYNTGNDFIYDDDFSEDTDTYFKRSNQKDEVGNRMFANLESNGRFHSDWLTMMYSRLRLARNLMREDAVIFISIDDNEVANLRKLCDEIYGEENFVAQFVVQTNPRGRSLDRYVAKTFEYIICYAKSVGSNCIAQIPKTDKALKEYDKQDEKGNYRLLELRNRNPVFNRGNRPNLFYPIYTNPESLEVSLQKSEYYSQEVLPKNSKGEDGCWTWGKSKVQNESHLLVGSLASTGNWRIFRKDYVPEGGATTKEKTLWTDTNLNHENGKEEIGRLFNTSGNKVPFDFPKSVHLIKKCLAISVKNVDDIVLDFFSGSCTTAQAIMELNAEDGVNRRYIMIQLPESCDEESDAYKSGYKNIADIGKDRIRFAGKKIKEGHADKDGINQLDIGFRVLKADSSNMKDIYYAPDAIEQADIFDQIDNIKEDRSSEDLLFQILLDWGVDLSVPITHEVIGGRNVLFVDHNTLAACFESNIDKEFVKILASRQPLRVVFRDASFNNDSTKINIEQIFKLVSPNTEIKTI